MELENVETKEQEQEQKQKRSPKKSKSNYIYCTKLKRGDAYAIRVKVDDKIVEVARFNRSLTKASATNSTFYKGFYSVEEQLATVLVNWTNLYHLHLNQDKLSKLDDARQQEVKLFIAKELKYINSQIGDRVQFAKDTLKDLFSDIEKYLAGTGAPTRKSELMEIEEELKILK